MKTMEIGGWVHKDDSVTERAQRIFYNYNNNPTELYEAKLVIEIPETPEQKAKMTKSEFNKLWRNVRFHRRDLKEIIKLEDIWYKELFGNENNIKGEGNDNEFKDTNI